MADTSCFYTALKNTSGQAMSFGWLPPHGQSLASGASVTVFGDIGQHLRRGPRHSRRDQTAFETALTTNLVEVIRTPGVILYDLTSTNVKMLRVNSGTLSVVDACQGSYTGAS